MKKLILLLAVLTIAAPILAQTSIDGRFVVGTAANRPTCNAGPPSGANLGNGDVYDDIDDGNIWKCNGGAWNGAGVPTFPTTPVGLAQVLTYTPTNTTPAWALPGVPGRSVTGATSTDTILAADCSNRVDYTTSVAVAVALPAPGTLAVPFCSFKIANATTGAGFNVTVTPGGGWTCSINNGAVGATCVISSNVSASVFVDPKNNSNWRIDIPVAGGVVGGTFGASPSSGYTFTSTPITTAPFNGDLLIGATINAAGTGSYTAGTNWNILSSTITLGAEYQIAGSASSYTSAITYSVSSGNWGSVILAFAPSGTPTKIQSNSNNPATSLAYGSNNGAGNLLVAIFRYNGASAAPMTSVTDTAGNTWVSAGMRAFEGYSKGAGDNNFIEVWYALNSIGGANTVTGNMGSGTTGGATHIAISEFSGVALTNALVDYAFTGSTTGATSIPGATTNSQYLIQAVNNTTGTVDFSGRDSGAVFRSAANARASTGGLLFFKNGIYPGQTSLHENVAGQTNWYVWGIPAPVNGTTEVSWHIVCESFTQTLFASLQTDGCIHTMMPSAYAGPQPTSTKLSGFWQRPNASFGSINNNAIFFVNGTVRIPDNQHTPSTSYDLFTTIYSSHVGTVADTGTIASDQLCSGLTPAAANIIGFNTNQSLTDETYFENTYVVGMNTPYSIISNHPVLLNTHAQCNQNAGSFNMAGNLYGGEIHHYQDIHNIAGIQLTCQYPGTRLDFNVFREVVVGGTFGFTSNVTESPNPGNCIGTFDVTTQSANGVALTVPPIFTTGGSGFRANEGMRIYKQGLITSNFTSAATTGTTKQTLATYTFAYNSVGGVQNAGIFQNNPGAVIRIKTWGVTATNGNTKTLEIDFGGTAVALINSTASNGAVSCTAEIIVSSVVNTQEINGVCDDGATHTVMRTAPGITGSAAVVTNIAATTPTASGDFTFKGLTIEYLGGQ